MRQQLFSDSKEIFPELTQALDETFLRNRERKKKPVIDLIKSNKLPTEILGFSLLFRDGIDASGN
jgi:hypothetical protein